MADKLSKENDTQNFLEEVRPKLNQLEQTRLEKLRSFNWRKKIAVPVGVVITPILGFIDYWLLLLQRGNEDSAAGLTFVAIAALWWWVTKPKRDYTNAYKSKILPDIAQLFGDFNYDVKGKIPMAQMKPSKIIPNHNSYKSEDLFTGEYQGVGIKLAEIHLARKSKNSSVTVFTGLAILLTHGVRKFYGHTIIVKDQNAVSGWLKKTLTNLKRANLVDPEFERIFDVYTNDQVEARYLLDPIIMENLKSLYEEYNGDKLFGSFYDDHILILVGSHEDHFEPAAIDVPATSEQSLLSMKREIGEILSIIDKLSLFDKRKRRAAIAETRD